MSNFPNAHKALKNTRLYIISRKIGGNCGSRALSYNINKFHPTNCNITCQISCQIYYTSYRETTSESKSSTVSIYSIEKSVRAANAIARRMDRRAFPREKKKYRKKAEVKSNAAVGYTDAYRWRTKSPYIYRYI